MSPPVIVAIVFMAFLFAGYREWLKNRSTRTPAGTSDDLSATLQSLEERLAQLEREREALAERIQNLETIVTSEAWIAQHDPSADTEEVPSSPVEDLVRPPESDSDPASVAEHTAKLARRRRSNGPTNGDLKNSE